jgi:surface polysaccharide O-acyltransferase-like enzyme
MKKFRFKNMVNRRTQQEKSGLEVFKDWFIEILEKTKDTPYALVSALSTFALIFFIVFGSALCTLSKIGQEWCWIAVLLIIAGMIYGAYRITIKTIDSEIKTKNNQN